MTKKSEGPQPSSSRRVPALSRDGSGTHGATGIGSCDRRPAPPREPPFRRDLRSRANRLSSPAMTNQKIGQETWRERVCHYVSISVVAVSLKKKKTKNTMRRAE